MIKISLEKWKQINKEWKGIWNDRYKTNPEMIGKIYAMSGCITGNNPAELGYLMFEGIDFIIED